MSTDVLLHDSDIEFDSAAGSLSLTFSVTVKLTRNKGVAVDESPADGTKINPDMPDIVFGGEEELKVKVEK